MNRIQLACYGLMASAFVMSGLLVTALPGRLDSVAQGALVINRENFTLMTARTRQDEEALFVLENTSQKLLIYTMNLGNHRLNPVGFADLSVTFGAGGPTGGGKVSR